MADPRAPPRRRRAAARAAVAPRAKSIKCYKTKLTIKSGTDHKNGKISAMFIYSALIFDSILTEFDIVLFVSLFSQIRYGYYYNDYYCYMY